MKKYFLTRFEPSHLVELINRGGIIEPLQITNVGRVSNDFSRGLGYTLMHDGEILGCGGSLRKNGESELWLVLDGTCTKHIKMVVKVIKGIIMTIRHIEKEKGNTILTAQVGKDFPLGRRFAEYVGMKDTGRERTNTITGRVYKVFAMEV